LISFSGCAKRASIWETCLETGVRARFLVARLERGSEEVGIEEGPGSDIVFAGSCVWAVALDGTYTVGRFVFGFEVDNVGSQTLLLGCTSKKSDGNTCRIIRSRKGYDGLCLLGGLP
jgi:hypothetical protein